MFPAFGAVSSHAGSTSYYRNMASSTDPERDAGGGLGILPEALTHNLELAATILMAVAAIMTAWTAFQSTKWGGVQADKFAEAGAM